ncbi:MAG: long-chain fatty acid--CoA ligase [Armatimonadetes bacterium]|nr:long-chain fatty acid--CoA ligase [Armatimonadota bacterium]
MQGIWHWLDRRDLITPRRQAVVDGDRRLTYRDLAARVRALAAGLRRRGIGRGDRVALLSYNRVETLEVLFALARLGAIMVPLNWRLTPPELAVQIADSAPDLMIADPEHRDQAEAAASEARMALPMVLIGDEYEEAVRTPPGSDAEGAFDDPLIIMYTSGTTGRPKGAVLAQGTQFWNSINIGTAIGLTYRDVTLTVLPMFHIGGLGLYALPTLHVGGRLVIQRTFDPEETCRLLRAEGVTAMFGVPAIYQALLQTPAFGQGDHHGVRFGVGGAPCPLPVIEEFERRGLLLQQGFGLTETAPTATLLPPEDAFRKKGSVGPPTLHVEARVVDDAGRDLPPGEIGEICLRGPNLFSGYWGLPEATAEVFSPPERPDDPAASGGDYRGWWFHTGDLGYAADDGFLYVADRKKDMIISGGENIYPAEVEQVLYQHPAVLDAAVIGIPDARWGEAAMALVVLKPGAQTEPEGIIAACQGRLARYKIPRRVVFVETLPRNAAGKVLKRVLRETYGKAGKA